jgi:hypothetical protein
MVSLSRHYTYRPPPSHPRYPSIVFYTVRRLLRMPPKTPLTFSGWVCAAVKIVAALNAKAACSFHRSYATLAPLYSSIGDVRCFSPCAHTAAAPTPTLPAAKRTALTPSAASAALSRRSTRTWRSRPRYTARART